MIVPQDWKIDKKTNLRCFTYNQKKALGLALIYQKFSQTDVENVDTTFEITFPQLGENSKL